VSARVSDDVQVRNVEFYVDGARAFSDASFPFEHRFMTPLFFSGRTNFTVRARAIDTGGNSAWSEDITVTLTPDMTPPRVVRFFPPRGGSVISNRLVIGYFNEPLDVATLNADSFELVWAGRDGLLGTADDAPVNEGVFDYIDSLNAALLRFTNDMVPGIYQVRVGPPLSDRPGNVMQRVFTNVFAVVPNLCEIRPTDCADSDGDGLPDSLEPSLGLDPSKPDSHDDGLPDGARDFDRDGLSNLAEILLGTDPRLADSDYDGLTDSDELVRGTDPTNPDSDGDGWPDGLEVAAGTDPRNAASQPARRVSLSSPPVTVLNLAPDPGATNRPVFSPVTTYFNQEPPVPAPTNRFIITPIVTYENQ